MVALPLDRANPQSCWIMSCVPGMRPVCSNVDMKEPMTVVTVKTLELCVLVSSLIVYFVCACTEAYLELSKGGGGTFIYLQPS